MTISHQNRQGLQSDLALKVHCDKCAKNVSNIVRIKCAECTDFDLCVECFSQGVELQQHKNNHDYHICDPLAFPIFERHWSASEELLFLDGIDQKGMGNFSDISVYLGSKSLQECKDHYYEIYIDSPYFPTPNLGKMLRNIKPIPYVEENPNEIAQELISKPTPSVPGNHEIGGFLPGRFEFDAEYDAEAETVVKDLEFFMDDSPEERELKLALFEIYNKSLDLKYHRRMFLNERNMYDYRKIQQSEKKKSTEEKAMNHQFKPFNRIMTAADVEQIMDGLTRSYQIKRKIYELQSHRKHKIMSFHSLKKKEEDQLAKSSLMSNAVFAMNAPVMDKPPSLSTIVSTPSMSQTTSVSNLDAKLLEYANLLSEDEIQFCSILHLTPKIYLTFKQIIMQYSDTMMTPDILQAMLKISPGIAGKLYTFWTTTRVIKDSMQVD